MRDAKAVLAVLLFGLCLRGGVICLAEEEAGPAETTDTSLSAAAGAATDTAQPAAAAAEKDLDDYRKMLEGAAASGIESGKTAAPEIFSEMSLQPMMSPAQGETPMTEAAAGTKEEMASAGAAERKPSEWVWGEVVSVDEAHKQIVIRHLDYETYEEVQMTLVCDDKSLFENVPGLAQVKPGDGVTVDYNVQDGVNIAGLVVVEQKEAGSGVPSASTEIVKDTAGPPSPMESPISTAAEMQEPPFLAPPLPSESAVSPAAPSQEMEGVSETTATNPPAPAASSAEGKTQP